MTWRAMWDIDHWPGHGRAMTRYTVDRRLDRVLKVTDVFLAAVDHAAELVRGPRCPWCRQRTRHLTAHIHINHQGDA